MSSIFSTEVHSALFGGRVLNGLVFCRKVCFKLFALSEDQFGRLVTAKPFRAYWVSALLVCLTLGGIAGGGIGGAAFVQVLFLYPAVRLLFAIFRRLKWDWFC